MKVPPFFHYIQVTKGAQRIGNRHFDAVPLLYGPTSGWSLTIWG